MRRVPSRRADAGFTFVEMLTVVAILSILMALLIYGIAKYRQEAYMDATRSVIRQLSSALDAYKAEFGDYPPDGFDPAEPVSRLVGGQQQRIRGSQCLVYFLGHQMLKDEEVGSEVRRRQVGPFMEFTKKLLSGGAELEELLEDPKTEVVDSWGNPIHYDRVELDRTTKKPKTDDQSASAVHTAQGFVADVMHGPDPRRAGGSGGIQTRNAGAYDLWSHGMDVEDPTDDITNWKN